MKKAPTNKQTGLPRMEGKRVKTVGDLRRLIQDMPDDTPLFTELSHPEFRSGGAQPGLKLSTRVQTKDAPKDEEFDREVEDNADSDYKYLFDPNALPYDGMLARLRRCPRTALLVNLGTRRDPW